MKAQDIPHMLMLHTFRGTVPLIRIFVFTHGRVFLLTYFRAFQP
jgi:hypothetical protein